jgi:hypothetical protein
LSNAKATCIRDNNGPNDKSSTMGNGENIKYGSIDSIFTLCGKEKLIRNKVFRFANLLFRLVLMVLTVDIMDSLFNLLCIFVYFEYSDLRLASLFCLFFL